MKFFTHEQGSRIVFLSLERCVNVSTGWTSEPQIEKIVLNILSSKGSTVEVSPQLESLQYSFCSRGRILGYLRAWIRFLEMLSWPSMQVPQRQSLINDGYAAGFGYVVEKKYLPRHNARTPQCKKHPLRIYLIRVREAYVGNRCHCLVPTKKQAQE